MTQASSPLAALICAAALFNACAFGDTPASSPVETPNTGASAPSQSALPNAAMTADVRPETPEEKALPWHERESLVLGGLMPEAVADRGFTPFATWTGEAWQSFRGGDEHGSYLDSLITFGFEQDLSALFKKENLGRIGLSAFYYAATKNDAKFDGLNSSPSNIFSGDMTRVFEIYYANEFKTENGSIGFRVGQLAADEDFMGLDYADVFLNSNFGAIPAVAGAGLFGKDDVAFAQYANATPGLVVYYTHNDFDVTLGLYNGNAGQDVPGNHGFDYELQDIAFWYQLGQNYQVAGRNGRVAFGGNYHSGTFENFKTGEGQDGFYSFYLNLQQDFVLDEEGNPIFGAFCRLAWAPEENISACSRYVDAGINWFGPIPSRKDDVFALGVSAMYANSYARDANGIYAYETCIEATYKAQITPAISLQPTFQVYFNPATSSGDRETAFLAGIRVEVNL